MGALIENLRATYVVCLPRMGWGEQPGQAARIENQTGHEGRDRIEFGKLG
jgi:hypothetical protein